MIRTLVPVAFIASILGTAACSERVPAGAPASATAARTVSPSVRSVRTRFTTHRALIDDAARAELDTGGLVVDFGAADQHKFVRGGWRSGWGKRGTTGQETWLALEARVGWLDIPARARPPSAIRLRARSTVAAQRLTLLVAGRELGTAALGPAWTELRVPVPPGAWPSDRVRLEVRAATRTAGSARAELDWLWLAETEDAVALGPRVMPSAIAGLTRRALVAETPRTYSFYLKPPPDAHLVVDLGASESAELAVTVTADDAKPTELVRERVEASWVERAISLAPYAGRAIRLDLTSTDQRGSVAWGEPEIVIDASPAPAPPARISPPRNVIVLVMDTARADAFTPFAGPDRVVRTPSYDAFAARSTVFTAAYNNENWTKPSVATTLSGLYPSTHGAKRDDSVLSDEVELLSERLRRDGFATAGFVANGYVSEKFGFEQGWDTFVNYIREERRSEAEHVFEDALAWLAKHTRSSAGNPYFLYVQTIDPHVPYRVDRAYWTPYFTGDYGGWLGRSIDADDQVALSSEKRRGSTRDRSWLRALYFGELAYHDDHLGRFLAQLETRGILDDSLVVITNDHGEELGERGRFGHGHQIFEEMVRAPLLLYHPGIPGGRTIGDIVEHVDLAPTILDALGREPLAAAEGQSFLPLVTSGSSERPRYAVIEFLEDRRAIRIGTWKLVTRGGGEATLFDLAADPGERHDLSDTAPIARRLCEVHLGEALAVPVKARRTEGSTARRVFEAGAADIDPQMRRQLEALGYFGSADPELEAPDHE